MCNFGDPTKKCRRVQSYDIWRDIVCYLGCWPSFLDRRSLSFSFLHTVGGLLIPNHHIGPARKHAVHVTAFHSADHRLLFYRIVWQGLTRWPTKKECSTLYQHIQYQLVHTLDCQKLYDTDSRMSSKLLQSNQRPATFCSAGVVFAKQQISTRRKLPSAQFGDHISGVGLLTSNDMSLLWFPKNVKLPYHWEWWLTSRDRSTAKPTTECSQVLQIPSETETTWVNGKVVQSSSLVWPSTVCQVSSFSK